MSPVPRNVEVMLLCIALQAMRHTKVRKCPTHRGTAKFSKGCAWMKVRPTCCGRTKSFTGWYVSSMLHPACMGFIHHFVQSQSDCIKPCATLLSGHPPNGHVARISFGGSVRLLMFIPHRVMLPSSVSRACPKGENALIGVLGRAPPPLTSILQRVEIVFKNRDRERSQTFLGRHFCKIQIVP